MFWFMLRYKLYDAIIYSLPLICVGIVFLIVGWSSILIDKIRRRKNNGK